MRPLSKVVLVFTLLFSSFSMLGCPGGDAVTGSNSSGSGDWWFHFACNGDYECLTTNYLGKPSGDSNEGPVYSGCKSLIEFASRFWGDAATYSCDHSPTSTGGSTAPTGVASVVVSPSSTSIVVGGTAKLTAVAYDASGKVVAGAQFTWTSSNLNIVGGTYLNDVETALGVSIGTATMTASSGGKSGQATVTVTAPVIASVVVSPFTSYVAVGANVILTAVALDANGNAVAGATFSWASSDLSIVDGTYNNSVLTATGISAGSVVIHATAGGHQGTATITSLASTTTAFDGVYSYNFTSINPSNGFPGTTSPAVQIVVVNGVISSIPVGYRGVVVDTFGTVSFQGPCPVPVGAAAGTTGTATYSGTLNFGSGLAKNGSGSWTCNTDAGANSGATNHWTVFNGH